jgi:hypothetical protein
LVDPAQRHAVELVRPSDEEKAAIELLEEYDTLATETASEEDKDGAGSDGGAEFCGCWDLAALLGLANVLSGVVAGGLDCGDKTSRAVLGAANSDLLVLRGGLNGLLLRFLLALEETSLGEHLRARETADVRGERLATGHGLGGGD